MAKNNNGKRPYRDNVREFERRPLDERQRDYNDEDRRKKPAEDMYEIKLKKYRKKPIYLEDMNGKPYVISGNFTVDFMVEMAKYIDEVKKLESDMKTVNSISEKAELVSKLFDIYKEWCLKLINYNVDGIEYTMQDVNMGFNDMEAIKYLMGHIAKLIARAEKEMNSNENR